MLIMIRSFTNATLPIKKNGHMIVRTISNIPNATEATAKKENNRYKQQQQQQPEQSQEQPEQQQQPWKPTKRVSRVTMEKIRSLAALYPDHYNSVSLATEFRISPEAVKRILKSKFRPEPTIADRQEKNRYAAMGVRKQQIQSKIITFSSTSSSDKTSARKSWGKHHSSSSTTTSTWKRD